MSAAGTLSLGNRMTAQLRSTCRASFFAMWSKASCCASIASEAASPPNFHCGKPRSTASLAISSPAGIGQVPSEKPWIPCPDPAKSSASVRPTKTGLFARDRRPRTR
jgi:hypothetical protein